MAAELWQKELHSISVTSQASHCWADNEVICDAFQSYFQELLTVGIHKYLC